MMTALIFLQPSATARLTRATAYSGWVPIGNEFFPVHCGGVIGQHSPNTGMLAFVSAGMMLVPRNEKDPITAVTLSDTALRAHAEASVGLPCSSQTSTESGRPPMPPWALIHFS